MLLITFLRQQNDVYLHFGTGFQENKTEHTTFDFMLLSYSEIFTILTIPQSNVIQPQQQRNVF